MQIPKGALVAVADGQKLSLFQNGGDEAHPKLTALPVGEIDTDNKSGGKGHASSSANPDDDTQDEDGFVAGVVDVLNKKVLTGKVDGLIVIAAPRALGEMRKHYHAKLKDVLVGEISKDLTGQTSADIEKAIAAA
ncbi:MULTISPECIES: host attachment family protein [unclassified Aureimonas]|uniref:host attachment family protein n=1 Tax=unclassified Aureimonas TaxID=2615206 RepID=UPI0006F4DFC9|nr:MULTISPECIES: host attachment protein [unclassified Aureimonas]KQT69109.1 host cell attachment protein [Aureimonas sp. Leaf460]KQT69342.1 host cell attachment protein [Aureimonas sp. Leaf427]